MDYKLATVNIPHELIQYMDNPSLPLSEEQSNIYATIGMAEEMIDLNGLVIKVTNHRIDFYPQMDVFRSEDGWIWHRSWLIFTEDSKKKRIKRIKYSRP